MDANVIKIVPEVSLGQIIASLGIICTLLGSARQFLKKLDGMERTQRELKTQVRGLQETIEKNSHDVRELDRRLLELELFFRILHPSFPMKPPATPSTQQPS